jgi:hypothetical protein
METWLHFIVNGTNSGGSETSAADSTATQVNSCSVESTLHRIRLVPQLKETVLKSVQNSADWFKLKGPLTVGSTAMNGGTHWKADCDLRKAHNSTSPVMLTCGFVNGPTVV